jgi:site-specific DNA-cytosine methylase
MKVLSLFDGMSCGQIALNRAGYSGFQYYASEINPHAIRVTQYNYPQTIQIGDVKEVDGSKLKGIDLLIGGSPCQGFSFAGSQLNFDDVRSRLFFEYVRILKEVSPKYFLLENVRMKKDSEDVISNILGVSPVRINSSLVSAQNRDRLYWTNIPTPSIEDKKIFLKDIYVPNSGTPISKETSSRPRTLRNYRDLSQKSFCLLATMYKLSQSNGMTVIRDGNYLRCITPLECERLQTVPDNYTSIVSNTRRYEMLGNGWTVDVIAEFFKNMSLPKDSYVKDESLDL